MFEKRDSSNRRIFLTLDHAPPTHVVIKTLCWVAFILPSTYWSRFLSKWSSNTERTSSLNGLLINTSTTCTRDVHPGDTLTRDVMCFFKSSFTLLVCCTRWTSGIRIFRIFKRIYPFGRNPFLHNLLITPSLFLIHGLVSSVITLFFLSTYSKTFASFTLLLLNLFYHEFFHRLTQMVNFCETLNFFHICEIRYLNATSISQSQQRRVKLLDSWF